MCIDFVVTWVDGSDPEWIAKKNKYQGNDEPTEVVTKRYRDWGIFKYWFRAVEKYAPWVNNIYVITDNQRPDFLDINHPKIKLVYHDEFIPKEYLPTFSSHVIENNMHRINGLSEYFVYFNDDMFLNRPVKPTDFFRRGKSCYEMIERPCEPHLPMEAHNYAQINNMAIINRHFSRKTKISKFINFRYSLSGIKNIFMLPWRKYSHFQDNHMPVPYLKSTIEEVWSSEQEFFDKISRNKFRTHEDANHFVFRYWDLARGKFSPYKFKDGYYSINKSTVHGCANDILRGDSMMICVNDGGDNDNFENNRITIVNAFESKFRHKSEYEI